MGSLLILFFTKAYSWMIRLFSIEKKKKKLVELQVAAHFALSCPTF